MAGELSGQAEISPAAPQAPGLRARFVDFSIISQTTSASFARKRSPDAWTTFNTRSMLGGALLGQKKYADAEPLLLQGYEGMKERETKIPAQGKIRLTEALERLVQLYEATGKKDQAAEWRKKLDAAKAAAKPQPKP
jgi:hypothetical protein